MLRSNDICESGSWMSEGTHIYDWGLPFTRFLGTLLIAHPVLSDSCSGNTAADRSIWCDYDLSTDYYEVVPETGVTREYWFEINQTTAAPDGYSRMVMAVNGSVPGPTIYADWGDTVKVHVINNLEASNNGTSVHFHGIRQNYTNPQDGVVSITQCPTAPGSEILYTWRATQYGTADVLYASAQSSGPPTLDNGLINGTNVYGDDDSDSQTGSRLELSVVNGTSYRMRLVNAAIDTHFKFMIDNHTMTVIANDLVPIVPYETTVLDISMGQRYDIVVKMDQEDTADDFWLRAIPQAACSDNDSSDNIKAIIHYGSSSSTPTTSAYSYTDECVDEDLTDLVPYLAKDADSSYWSNETVATVGFNDNSLFRWKLNSVSMMVEWANPTLLQIYNNESDWSNTSNIITLSEADEWAYLIIETEMTVSHPIHLHGHDFMILAQGSGDYSSSDLNLSNPPRRDVAILPDSGYLVLAFKTDNP
ncbi:unnamed protein product, partial [Aureobasidium vineae]